MNNMPLFNVTNGLATLGPDVVQIRNLLEKRFLSWADECGAESMLFPPLMSVKDLDGLDYFRNFPHLALVVTRIRTESLTDDYARGDSVISIPNAHLEEAGYALPSAACYNAYLHLRGSTLDKPKYITTVANCFRNEKQYEGLQRLWGFTMREVVCIGSIETVKSHLLSFKDRIQSFAAKIGLPLTIQVAEDPFYEPQSSRAVMQRLFPVKEEFVYRESVAIASVNFHRNFFGERCQILGSDQQPMFSGCAAFGIERWIHALLDQFQFNIEAITSALA